MVNPTSRYAPTYSVGFFVLIIFILQGGIHNNNIINSDFLLDNSIIQEEKND